MLLTSGLIKILMTVEMTRKMALQMNQAIHRLLLFQNKERKATEGIAHHLELVQYLEENP